MSFYVRRTRDDGRPGWTGPLRTRTRADREAAAWNDTGGRFTAVVVETTPDVKREIREWEKWKAAHPY